jgi:UDP-hydrolysing UDP-N-acetyl-D-glucosamine 2-epimerase
MSNRKICVVTGTRAEYGLLRGLMRILRDDSEIELQTVVCASHLPFEFGSTYQEIEKDGFTIHAKVEMTLSSDSPAAISKSMGLGCIGFADAFDRLAPNLLVLLGDRYEALAAAQTAMAARIPIAHIHGGEATEGLIDEAIRHAVTKMSHLHFTSAEQYRRRVIQLGEQPDRVFTVGAPGLDNIRETTLLDRKELEEAIGFKFAKTNVLVTFHPETLSELSSSLPFGQLLAALDSMDNTGIVFTKANSDTDGRVINKMIDDFVAKDSNRSISVTSLGQLRYLSAMGIVDAVIGNSSSGIIEAPSMGVPTVNIGGRQAGRLRASSVIDCDETVEAISIAIEKALSPDFRNFASKISNPYGDGKAAKRIADTICRTDLQGIVVKKFYDLPGIS